MSFGVGDEQGYIYSAVCRAATQEEAAPEIARRAAIQARQQALCTLRIEHERIMAEGEYPRARHEDGGPYRPDGETIPLGKGQDIYGGGEWFIIGPKWLWAVRNNGADGDDWALNNVHTGGAGAIGKRVPATPELAERLRALALAAQRQQEETKEA